MGAQIKLARAFETWLSLVLWQYPAHANDHSNVRP